LFGYVIENDLLYQYIKEGKFSISTPTESNAAYRIVPQPEEEQSSEVDTD
jgi:hypothetical protein